MDASTAGLQAALPPDQLAAWGQLAGAFFTLAAVVVALWVAIYDVRRRAREDREQRAAQALTVVAVVGTFDSQTDHRLRGYFPSTFQAVVIENFGRLPVTDVVIHGVTASRDGRTLDRWRIRDQTDGHHEDQSDFFLCAVLGPGVAERTGLLTFKNDDEEQPTVTGSARTATIDFSFLDADGIRWRRRGSAPPERVRTSTQ